ncbi:hypothetical protein B0T22DRAFT_87258 [Podospora appendiculata]|uniref:Uncharacterized protein n=1 Tax=Podospora appendiculata TaxID=314037 RepID=A0AAE0XKE8_9PEZI|nr:hypothetical protein B0T22DRAFT_87258 [Podospora appendiculata]
MTSAQYLTPSAHQPHHHHHHHHAGTASNSTSTVAYNSSDLDPYSAVSGVSSFNYPAAADSSLLTPVSSTGSPPLQPRSSKPMRGYHHTQGAVAGAQGPTPPNTSKMYYSYEMNSSSQGSSPMTVHPQVTEAPSFDMTPYIAQSSPGNHHPSSPKVEIPPPIDPYLGHFTVSGGNDAEVAHHPSFQEYHHFANVEVDPTSGFPYNRQHHPHMHQRMPSNGAPAPALNQPHPSQFRTHTTPRVSGIEDLRDPTLLMGNYPSHPSLSPGRRVQPRKKPTARKQARTPKASPHPGSTEGRGGSNGQAGDEDMEELTLRDDAPDDDKYLFQLRKEFLSEKGKGMWEEMKSKYSEKHQGNWEKAALQMKVSRAVAKFGVWPKKEIERLREAHQYYEEKRYQLVLARMKENGGCKVWDWKPQHIEAMLVKLGMEEPTIDDKTGTRRRKNKAARRRAGSQNSHHQNPMNDWPNGLGLQHSAFQGHPQHVGSVAAARQTSFDMLSDEASSVGPNFSAEQENDYLDQIFNKNIKVEGSLSPELMEMAYNENGGSRSPNHDLSHHQSERVARQACEQMMQQQRQEHAFPRQ